ncbi:hypothetical protein GCM10027347_52390 [Larkinella harenae]
MRTKPTVFMPNDIELGDKQAALKMIRKAVKKHPEAIADYVLVDILGEELNIKFFPGDVVDEVCKKHNITPRDYCMIQMRKQNGFYDNLK